MLGISVLVTLIWRDFCLYQTVIFILNNAIYNSACLFCLTQGLQTVNCFVPVSTNFNNVSTDFADAV